MLDRDYIAAAYKRFGTKAEAEARADEQRAAVLATRFDKQRVFIRHKSKRKAAKTTRRAGKTEADAAYLVDGCLSGPDLLCVFVAKTRQRAKDLTWKAVFKLCEAQGIETKANETLATRTFANGSMIRWTGADDIEELKKKRGDKVWLVVIDEAQDFEFSILRALVDDIFGPALEDLGGTICLTGTPGPVCAGYWYNVTRPEPSKREPGWEVFEWSVLDNPFMAHMRQRLPEIKKERGWSDDHPTYLREWCGQWVNDVGALFYKFDTARNTYRPDANGLHAYGPGWMHVRGWDLGLRDSMSLVYFGWRRDSRELYEVYSWKKSGVTSDDVMLEAQRIEQTLGLNVIGSTADTGGLGALVVKEVGARTGEHFDAAKKTEKGAHVRLMNDDFIAGRIKLIEGSPYAEEIAVLPKVPDWDEEKTGKPAPEHPRFPNHCCDAGLYAWRFAWNYLHEKREERPSEGTPEAYALEAKEFEERLAAEAEAAANAPWWEKA